MTELMQRALAAIGRWPPHQQDDAAELLLALDRLGPEAYSASADELAAIDEALEQVRRGNFASETEVDAAYARLRK